MDITLPRTSDLYFFLVVFLSEVISVSVSFSLGPFSFSLLNVSLKEEMCLYSEILL